MPKRGPVSVRAGRVNNTLLKSDGSRKKYSSSGSEEGGHLILNLPFFFFFKCGNF